MAKSWRDRQKTFFIESSEFEQDQRILDWLDYTKKTYYEGDVEYFQTRTESVPVDQADQALVIINVLTNIDSLRNICGNIIAIPKIALAINKFLLYSEKSTECADDYDIALLDYITELFPNRHITHFYVPNLNGRFFNFASPTTQFYIV